MSACLPPSALRLIRRCTSNSQRFWAAQQAGHAPTAEMRRQVQAVAVEKAQKQLLEVAQQHGVDMSVPALFGRVRARDVRLTRSHSECDGTGLVGWQRGPRVRCAQPSRPAPAHGCLICSPGHHQRQPWDTARWVWVAAGSHPLRARRRSLTTPPATATAGAVWKQHACVAWSPQHVSRVFCCRFQTPRWWLQMKRRTGTRRQQRGLASKSHP